MAVLLDQLMQLTENRSKVPFPFCQVWVCHKVTWNGSL